MPTKQNPQDRTVPLSAEPGAYKDDGTRQVPLSAEGGVYSRDGQNEPKGGTAGEKGVSVGGEQVGGGEEGTEQAKSKV
ncbi:hypothetical protein E4U43_006762 [Claviceps pusilla]|uniref:Uncharacterized protein n=1 Tax=Claviceps pusilla TaxID=123648 RepID=A0A9P7N1F6_9HYPO|nr:hypothetical protein E4U43_006762 [Claviceps pusilla]